MDRAAPRKQLPEFRSTTLPKLLYECAACQKFASTLVQEHGEWICFGCSKE